MDFVNQLLLNELAGSGVLISLLVAISYLFYSQMKSTIEKQREEKKELIARFTEINNQISGLCNKIDIFSNNMNNYVQDVDETRAEVVRAHQEFSKETSRHLDEMVRVSNQIRDVNDQLVNMCKKVTDTTGSKIDNVNNDFRGGNM